MNPNLDPVVYEELVIRPRLTPLKGGGFGLIVVIEEQTASGDVHVHRFERSEEFKTTEEAHAAGVAIARKIIDEGRISRTRE